MICIREGTGAVEPVGADGVDGVDGVEGAEGVVGLSLPQLLSIKDENKLATMNRFEAERMVAIFMGILPGCEDKTTAKRFQASGNCHRCSKKVGVRKM